MNELGFKYPAFEVQLDEIIERFVFKRMQKVMLALDWKWSRHNNYCIPSIATLRNTAVELLNEVHLRSATHKDNSCECGGLVAKAEFYPEGICYEHCRFG